jgi:hypothetical protein
MHHLTSTVGPLCFICTVVCIPVSAGEIAKDAIGTYERKGSYNQKVKIQSSSGGKAFRATFEVYTRGCLGEATLDGKAINQSQIIFQKKEESLPGGVCKINVRFSPDFNAIEVAHEFCGYSGVSCDFNGKLRRTKR